MTTLVPINVRTFGRTGSTLLMQILATDERVCFERSYPFEHRYLTYAYNLARMIRSPVEDASRWNNDLLFQCRSPMVGGLPYGDVKGIDVDSLSHEVFLSTWVQFSRSLRRSAGLKDDTLAWYAEKAPQQVADMANDHLGARNIFLLRDPRDEMVSIKSFNAKRGFAGFGWQVGDDDTSYARRLCRNRRNFLQKLCSMNTDERRIALRYEDLVLDGAVQTEKLSDWLGAGLNYEDATADRSIQRKHMTSRDAASSVERWRAELTPDVRAIFVAELGSELDSLGYALD